MNSVEWVKVALGAVAVLAVLATGMHIAAALDRQTTKCMMDDQ